MHEVLVNCLGGLSLPRKCVVRLTDRPNMTLDVHRGRKTTIQQQQQVDGVNPIAFRLAKTLWSFGCSECSRVKILVYFISHF